MVVFLLIYIVYYYICALFTVLLHTCIYNALASGLGSRYFDHPTKQQVQYLYLSTYLSVLDVLEYLVYGNAKVLVLVLDQKVLGTYK